MNVETLDQLPDGKTELPGVVTINKMGKSIVLDMQIRLKLEGKTHQENQEKRGIIQITETKS